MRSPVLRSKSIIALCLVFALLLPLSVAAAAPDTVAPCASYYLDAYNTYVCAMGGGELQIWFEVMGTGIMDELGTLSILLYESTDNANWSYVDTFLHEDCPSMLLENDFHHMDYVPYYGAVKGRYYKAYVCIWAGKNGGGDSRYMWTPSERAT